MAALSKARITAFTVFVGLLLHLYSLSCLAKTLDFSGEINSEMTAFSLEINILQAPLETFTKNAADLDKHIEIYLPQDDNNPLLHAPAALADNNHNIHFYWRVDNVPSPQQRSTDTNYDLKYKVTILRNSLDASSAISLKDVSAKEAKPNTLSVQVKFFDLVNGKFVAGTNQLDKTIILAQTFAVPLEAPQFGANNISSSHRALTINWQSVDGSGQVPYSGGKPNRAPSQVQLMLFKASETGTLPLKAVQLLNSDTGETVAAHCEYSVPSDTDPQCVKCTPADASKYGDQKQFPIYLLSDQDEDDTIVRNELVNNTKGSYAVKNLSYIESYVVMLQYEKGGLRSDCVMATPERTASLTELNGASEAELKQSACFIATAAYGHPLDAKVATFVWFRDTFLETFAAGRRLVDLYYTYSPGLATLIEGSSTLRTLTRGILWLPERYITLLKTLKTYPLAYVNVGGALSLLVLAGLLLGLRPHRRKGI